MKGFSLLTYKDSNLECQNQKLVCYQLHHRSVLYKSERKFITFLPYKKVQKNIFSIIFNFTKINSLGGFGLDIVQKIRHRSKYHTKHRDIRENLEDYCVHRHQLQRDEFA